MQVGDLVKLSSYGESSVDPRWDFCGGWGIVTKVHGPSDKYPIHAHWYKKNGKEFGDATFHPRELKSYKPDKK